VSLHLPSISSDPSDFSDRGASVASSRVDLVGIEAIGHHGVYDEERRDGQRFVADVTWWLDTRPAAASDDLARTVDYSVVARLVHDILAGEPADLIETVAERIAAAVIEHFPVERVVVTVHKPEAPLGLSIADVRVTIERVRPAPPAVADFVFAPEVDPIAGDDLLVMESEPKGPPGGVLRRIVCSIGSNVGDRQSWLQFAVSAWATTPGVVSLVASSIYETAAVGALAQADFLNAVVILTCELTADEALTRAEEIERAAGRTRIVPHGPRTLDIDLIDVAVVGTDGRLSPEHHDTPRLTLPHPRAQARAFVLVPWEEIDPTARLKDRPLAAWLGEVADQTIRWVGNTLFVPMEQPPVVGEALPGDGQR
jgi:dihydroneopterin aldolase/2-amino-4-hydroxy-6-hydroxymethyldihydropteridine diphosphokinase